MIFAQHVRCLLVAAVLVSALPAGADAQRRQGRAPGRRAQAGARGDVERRVEALLARMTLEEKLGQLQQSGGDIAGKAQPPLLEAARAGRLGSTLGVRGARNANELQRVAVEETRLKIPLIFGFDVIHGYRTIFPIPLGEAAIVGPCGRGAFGLRRGGRGARGGTSLDFRADGRRRARRALGSHRRGRGRRPIPRRGVRARACARLSGVGLLAHPTASSPAPSTSSPTARPKRGATTT